MWAGGWREIFLAALVVPKIVYDLFIHLIFIRALTDISTNAPAHWNHAEILEARSHRVPDALLRAIAQTVITIVTITVAFILALLGVQW
ncbi:hypothetical protein HNP40_002395 [Mycobacteroides chelonae]|nr:hypothetical protein [Mycobacteroides chelonae]